MTIDSPGARTIAAWFRTARRQRGPASWPAAVLFVLAAASPAAAAPAPGGAEAAAAIRAAVESGVHPGLHWPHVSAYRDAMRAFYEPAGWAPAWLDGTRPRDEAGDALDALFEGGSCGFDPEDYDATWLLAAYRRAMAGPAMTGRELGEFDAALTLAVFRQISDRHLGRVNPRSLGVELDIERKKLDLAVLVRTAIDGDRVRETVLEAEPRFAQYERVKEALVAYRDLAAAAPAGPLPPATRVEAGQPYGGAAALRRLLAALGDLPPVPVESAEGDGVYTADLAAGVARFQRRHGLPADGVLGAATLVELNTPLSQRVRQLELALERMRWLPDLGPGPVIVVNIPAFRLWGWATGQDERAPAVAMDVVVGRAVHSETPLFTGTMQYVVFRPYWNVPYEIVRKEIVPELRRDPAHLEKEDMELLRGATPVAAPAGGVTPEVLAELARGSLQIRQRPGERNSLGLVKFAVPNEHSIYLHDTPTRSAFSRSRRDLSHGCVRVKDPVALAEFVLAGNGGWTPARIVEAMHGPVDQRVDLAVRVPVYILYTTAFCEAGGTVDFRRDLYGHDARLAAALAAVGP